MDALWDLRRAGKNGPDTAAVAVAHLQAAVAPAFDGSGVAVGGEPVDAEAVADLAGSSGSPQAAAAPGPPPVWPAQGLVEDAEEALMYGILRDCYDAEHALRKLEASMEVGLTVASSAGGARHATAVISSRILSVARRKANLLHDVESRIAAFAEVDARREELLPLIVADKEKVPETLSGILPFIAKYTHKGCPSKENKSHFAIFAASFKLPREHATLLQLKTLAEDAGEFWAKACLSEAEKGHGHAVLRRLFDVSLGTGVDMDHPMLVRAIRILNDRLAERVLQDAKERQQKDAKAEEMGRTPKAGVASDLGDKIEQEIFGAVAEGVPESDARLKQALEICKALRNKDAERKRMEARSKRLAEQDAKKPK